MTVKYDDYFKALASQQEVHLDDVQAELTTTRRTRHLTIPDEVLALPFKGLERLVGKGLVIGKNTGRCPNPRFRKFSGADLISIEEINLWGVYVLESYGDPRDGETLPQIADIGLSSGLVKVGEYDNVLKVEYFPDAVRLLEQKPTKP